MYRRDVVLRAMLPMALVVWLIHWRLFIEYADWGLAEFLLPILTAYVLGRGVARREKARLCEIFAGLGLSSIVLSVATSNPFLILTTLFLGGAGLFLLPLRCSALRANDPECAVPMPETRNTALAFVAILCLCSATCGMGWQESLYYGALFALLLYVPAMIIALAYLQSGKTRTGAEIGSIAALVITIFLVLLSVLGMPVT